MLGSHYSSERTCALAGIASCCILVDELSTSGSADQEHLHFFTEAFLDTDPSNITSAFRPQNALASGLQLLRGMGAGTSNESDRRRLSYTVQSIQLMQQFMRRDDLLKMLADGIPQIKAWESLDERLLAMGELYERSASTLSFRIQIQGSQGYLRQPEVAQKIRALLFCALRFALLWRQSGGSKFDFIIRKRNIGLLAQDILSNILTKHPSSGN